MSYLTEYAEAVAENRRSEKDSVDRRAHESARRRTLGNTFGEPAAIDPISARLYGDKRFRDWLAEVDAEIRSMLNAHFRGF